MKKTLILLSFVLSALFTVNAQTPSAQDIIKKYVDAIGGADAINKVDNLKMTMEGSIMGQAFIIKTTFMKPNYYLLDTSVGGQSVQKVIFTGTSLKMSGMQGSKEFTEGTEFEAMKNQANGICSDMNFEKDGYELSVKGVEKVKGKEAYAVIAKKGDQSSTHYYDKETGLKVKTTVKMKTPQGEMEQESTLSDYQSVDGIKFPFKLSQNAGGMEIEMKVKSVEVNKGVDITVFQ